MGARRGCTTQTPMRAPLFRHICVASHPRCHQRRDPFPGRHLTSLWHRLLSRHFLPCSHHSYFRNPQRNHHPQAVTRNLKHSWEIAPPTPINYRIVIVIYPYRTRLFVTSWDNCAPSHTPLLFAGSKNIRVDHLHTFLTSQNFTPTSHRVCTIIICVYHYDFSLSSNLVPLFLIIVEITTEVSTTYTSISIVHILVWSRTLCLHLV